MAVSVETVTITKQACLLLERSPPVSLEDGTDLARDLLLFYPEASARSLEAADWSFASRLAFLPPIGELPAGSVADPDLPFVFAYPPHCARLLEVGTGYEVWRRDAEAIRCDTAGPLRVRYTDKAVAENLWPAEFRTVVGLQLAIMLAPMWLQTGSKIERLQAAFDQAMRQARRNLAQDASPARYDGLPDRGHWPAAVGRA